MGRIVHYVAHGTPGGEFPAGVCRAGIVTEVKDARSPNDRATGPLAHELLVSLTVLNPTGLFFNLGCTYGTGPGCWHWPERA